MHVAVLAPISWRVPPRHYGPWEQVVATLVEGLVDLGLEVTLFATADSQTRADLAAVSPRPYSEDSRLDPKVWECLHIAQVFERASEFDLIHNHFDFLPLSYSRLVETPLLTTIHGFSSPRILPAYQRYNEHCHYVSISDADRRPELDYIATVYHGIELQNFTLRKTPGEYLLHFGRIHPDKGAAEAIQVARSSGWPLVLAGIIQDQEYFECEVAPYLDGRTIRYVGSVGPAWREKLLSHAYALLHLINFDEPFGLSMVEAMACGTPVVAVNRGSIPEIIVHGETGFIVEDAGGALACISAVEALDREKIHQYAAMNFSRERMARDYLQVYQQIVG